MQPDKKTPLNFALQQDKNPKSTDFANSTRRLLPQDLLVMYRKRANLTQDEVATALDLKSRRMVMKWEAGETLPNSERLKTLIELYLYNNVFMSGQEYSEALALWSCVKNLYDTGLHTRSVTYTIFDEGWFGQIYANFKDIESLADHVLPAADEADEYKKEHSKTKPLFLKGRQTKSKSNPVLPVESENAEIAEKPIIKLPAQITSFVGRKNEVEEVRELLCHPHTRLLTITGTGGIGKTRLSVEAASTLGPYFQGGIYFVALDALQDFKLVAPGVSRVFGLVESNTETSSLQNIETYLTSQNKPILLILDNFEHVLPAADIVQSLLKSSSSLKILVTSRVTLGLYGEYEFILSPMSMPAIAKFNPKATGEVKERNGEAAASDWNTFLADYDAPRLFTERSRMVNRNFKVTTRAEYEALGQICQRLDGLPLALELVAAQTKFTPLPVLVKRLEKDLRGSESRSGASLKSYPSSQPRHQTLHQAIEWSYNLLSAQEQVLFTKLAIFAGTWQVEAAFAIAGDDLVADLQEFEELLLNLANKSLLTHHLHPTGTRFGMLSILRDYALTKFKDLEEAEQVYHNYRVWYQNLIQDMEVKSTQGQFQAEALEIFELERANWQALLEHFFGEDSGQGLANFSFLSQLQPTASEIEPGLKLIDGLSKFWEIRNYYKEGIGWLEKALKQGELVGLQNTKSFSNVLTCATTLYFLMDNFSKCRTLAERNLELAIRQGWDDEKLKPLNALSGIYICLGNYELAKTYSEQGLHLSQHLNNRRGQMISLNNLVIIARRQGRLHEAKRLSEENLILARQLGDNRVIAIVLTNLANISEDMGEIDTSIKLYLETLELIRGLKDREFIAGTLGSITLALIAQKEFGLAEVYLAEAEKVYNGFEDNYNSAYLVRAKGDLYFAKRDYEAAWDCYEQVKAIYEILGNQNRVSEMLRLLGEVALGSGKLAKAKNFLVESLHICHKLGAINTILDIIRTSVGVATGLKLFKPAALLLGALARQEETYKLKSDVAQVVLIEEALIRLKVELNEEEKEASFNEGQLLSLERVIEYIYCIFEDPT